MEAITTTTHENGKEKEFNPKCIKHCGRGYYRYTESYKQPRYSAKQIRMLLKEHFGGKEFTIINIRPDTETLERIYLLSCVSRKRKKY
jgi:hypothetical protein